MWFQMQTGVMAAVSNRIKELLHSCPPWGKVLLLLTVFVLLYGGCIAFAMGSWVLDPLNYPDLSFYQERTSAALAGEVPYRDLEMESPPLIVYMMLPAQLMGGELFHYAAWFSLLSFAGALATYGLLRRLDEDGAFLGSMLFLVHPATVSTAAINIQDESVIAVLIVVSLSLLAVGMWRSALALSVIGVASKAFTVFLVPYILISGGDSTRLRRGLAITTVLVFLLAVPFLVLAPEQFLSFPSYYLSQALGGGVTDGMSLWRFLHDLGITLPASFYALTLTLSYLIVLWLIHTHRPDGFAAGFLVLLPFLLFFPKIYPYYLVMALAPLCLLAGKKGRLIWPSVGIYLLSVSTMGFVTIDNQPLWDGAGAWVPVLLNLFLSLLMIWAATRVLDEGTLWGLEKEGTA
jgi:hypothetical protein